MGGISVRTKLAKLSSLMRFAAIVPQVEYTLIARPHMVRRATCVVSGCWRARSVLFSQHDCENPHCDRQIGWIWRLAERSSVVRVDFPEKLLACELNDAEVVLTVRIIVGVEPVEAAHRRAQGDAVRFG